MAQERITLSATVRDRVGKGAARHVRREGKIPAVIYGDKKPPEPVAIDYQQFSIEYLKGNLASTVIEVDVSGDKKLVIPRDIQLDPVKDIPVHADLMRISSDGIVRVAVPVRITNEDKSPGMKRGGILNVVRHEVEVACPYDKIPSELVVDLEGRQIGDSIHISALSLPADAKPVIDDRDFTVVTIGGRGKKDDVAEETAAPAEEEAAEGEEEKKEEK